MIQCENCDKKIKKNGKNTLVAEVWLRPFDDKPEIYYYCSEECETADLYERDDFCFFNCQGCYRIVCEQNPSNGWHVQVRYVDGEAYCLKCYEADLLENGQPVEDFEKGTVEGMFFNHKELEQAGFNEVETYFIRSTEDAKPYCQKAVELIAKGQKVITDFDSMAIGGLEGTVALWAKS